MPRKFYNDGQEIIFEDLNAESSLLESELYERVIWEMLQRTDNAFFQGSFSATYVSGVTLNLIAGLGFQTDNTQVDPEPKKRPLYLSSASLQTLASPDSSHDRIDLICVKSLRVNSDTETRNYKDPISSAISAQSFVVETDWGADIQIVAGTPGVSPTVPATPSGYLPIASLLVHAVTGLGGQGDITDLRNLMPIGGAISVNSSTFNRAPASSSESLQVVLAAFDAYLTNGLQGYTDYVVQGSDPAAPASGNLRFYVKGGVAFFKDSSSVVTPLGSGGGGGGGGANWNGVPGTTPLTDSENGEKVWLFQSGGGQKLTLFVRVPSSYIIGRQITAFIGEYSPSTSGTILLASIASLVRQGVDAAGSTANQRTSTNTALTNTVANMYRQTLLDLTDASGKINSFSVSPGDLIRVDLSRGSDTDTADIRFIPSATEVKFS